MFSNKKFLRKPIMINEDASTVNDGKNIQEWVVNEIARRAFEYDKLKRKYKNLKHDCKSYRCNVCKVVQSRPIMSKRCGHGQCHICYSAESSLIFNHLFVVDNKINRSDCMKCWIKNGYTTYDEIKKNISAAQWEHYKSYSLCIDKKFNKN